MTISLDNITIGYGKIVVAEGINATLGSGHLTCLLGANGAGKSTLLRTLSAFQPALSGSIKYDDRELDSFSPQERARLIGVVLTDRSKMEYMSVSDLVAMGRMPYTGFWGGIGDEDREIVNEAIDTVGIRNLADRLVDTLSDGERQKVMIAKALAQQTPVIFLDEPTAFLDFPSKVETMQLLQSLCHDLGKTVFLSTHDVEIALQMADSCWLMEKSDSGMLLHIGSPRELADNGVISRFVERKGVVFDKESMAIKIGDPLPA
ncbi:MAG: ABC transporter ATP-binding protein [Prevotellaceae bacterium]|nr:ABC transporter ATP-binding protein [Prevotellaceae bacterium]